MDAIERVLIAKEVLAEQLEDPEYWDEDRAAIARVMELLNG